MGVYVQLLVTMIEKGKYTFPYACYTMSSQEKHAFCEFLVDLKYPDGYSSIISWCIDVQGGKIYGMQCHDYHVFLHHFLPLSIRVLRNKVCETLIELSSLFRELCSKTLSVDILQFLEKSVVLTLCKLEKTFPPSFFNIMVHFLIHLVDEAKIVGPISFDVSNWKVPS